MAPIKPINFLLVLSLFAFAEGTFTPFSLWNLKKDTSATISQFSNSVAGGAPLLSSDSHNVNTFTDCTSFSKNGGGWELQTDFSTQIVGKDAFVIGFWVYFEITKQATKIFQFGDSSGPHYVVSSPTDGTLEVAFYSDSTATDSNNNFSFTVPMGNFYIEKWFFLAFNFNFAAGSQTVGVYQSGSAATTQQSASGSSAPFALPNGMLSFGAGVSAQFNQVIVAYAVTQSVNYKTITFLDENSGSSVFAQPCTYACEDGVCTQDDLCLSSSSYCDYCSVGMCGSCEANSGRDNGNWCQECYTSHTLKNGHCKFYLGCKDIHNCKECESSSTICSLCDTDYFKYDESATATSCLCNFYSACANSCTQCSPGPECFNCAEAIVQSGNTCRVDSLGFQISVEVTNIVIDFAHPIDTDLVKGTFTASSSSGQTISTTGWAFEDCTAGSIQCTIVTPNLLESHLPITLDLDFDQQEALIPR